MKVLSNGSIIYKGVRLSTGVKVEQFCILGKPPRGKKEGRLNTFIGKNSLIRPYTTIYAGVNVGKNFQGGHYLFIRENNKIGNDAKIGTNTILEPDNTIGDNVRIHSGCFLESVTIEDDVFIGPNVTFIDDLHPPCPRYKDCLGGPTVKRGAKIGAGSTILPGVTIGEYSLIGAGTVVTKDVSPKTVAVGNPTRIIKKLEDLRCIKKFYSRPYQWLFK